MDTPVEPRISLSVRVIKTLIDEETEKVTGKGKEYQTKNYPFIVSHDDPSKYSEDLKKKLESLTD